MCCCQSQGQRVELYDLTTWACSLEEIFKICLLSGSLFWSTVEQLTWKHATQKGIHAAFLFNWHQKCALSIRSIFFLLRLSLFLLSHLFLFCCHPFYLGKNGCSISNLGNVVFPTQLICSVHNNNNNNNNMGNNSLLISAKINYDMLNF